MKESIVFYKSFYEAIKELPSKNQLEIYNAIFKKYFYNEENSLKGISKGIFNLIIPNVDSANKRYFANLENGKKGGRPKTQTKPNNNPIETQLKPNHNLNDNVNDNDNDNDNDNVNDNSSSSIYNYIESNFGRTLSPIEYQEIKEWEDNELTRYAIKQAILKGKYNIKYISTILYNYKKNNIISVQQAQEEEIKFKNKGNKKETSWEYLERIKREYEEEENEKTGSS